jgi:hypothetical protein
MVVYVIIVDVHLEHVNVENEYEPQVIEEHFS